MQIHNIEDGGAKKSVISILFSLNDHNAKVGKAGQ
jgi:hypothetical protein